MTISELSDMELSLWIAKKLEPQPVDEWIAITSSIARSGNGLGMWNRTYASFSFKKPYPRDMVNDPAMTLLLLNKLFLERDYKQVLLDAETCFTDKPRDLNECEQDHEKCIFAHLHIYMHKKTLGRAVAEAWAIANGWA